MFFWCGQVPCLLPLSYITYVVMHVFILFVFLMWFCMILSLAYRHLYLFRYDWISATVLNSYIFALAYALYYSVFYSFTIAFMCSFLCHLDQLLIIPTRCVGWIKNRYSAQLLYITNRCIFTIFSYPFVSYFAGLDNITYNARRIQSFTTKVDRWTIKVKVLGLWDSIDPSSTQFMNMDLILLHSMFFFISDFVSLFLHLLTMCDGLFAYNSTWSLLE